MDADRIAELVGAHFESTVRVAVDHIGAIEADLHPLEAAFVERAVSKRRREFAAGRRLARQLLGADTVLLANPDRSPKWPIGIWGSIAHASQLCIVVVSTDCSIGVDVEPALPLKPKIERAVCTETELRLITTMSAESRGLAGKQIFCAKEAFYKAQYPVTRARLDFHDAEVDTVGPRFRIGRSGETTRYPGFLLEIDGYYVGGVEMLE